MMQAAGWLENPMKKRLAIRSRLIRKVSMPSSAQ